MIKVQISTRSQLQIEQDVQLEIEQQASINQLFNDYKKKVDVSEFDPDSSLEFGKLLFEEVVVAWQKQPFVILDGGRRLWDIEKAEKMNIIIYLPSPSEPIIICQSANIQCIIWDYRNMKPLINTLEGDPIIRKMVNRHILSVTISNKKYLWNDVKNKTMRSLIEGKLGTLIMLKLEVDDKFEVEEIQMKQKDNIAQIEGKKKSDKNGLSNPERKSIQSHNIIKNPSESKQINPSLNPNPLINQNRKRPFLQNQNVPFSLGQNEAGGIGSPHKELALKVPEKDKHIQGKKVEQIYIQQNHVQKKVEQIKPIIVQKVQSKKIEQRQIQKSNKPQENKQININNAVPVPYAQGELTLVIGFQAICSQSSGRKQINRQVSKTQCLYQLLPSIIKQLKQKGFDWADDTFDPIRDKKKISITYEGNQFHKTTKVFKSLINPSTKQITFNITRHYEGG